VKRVLIDDVRSKQYTQRVQQIEAIGNPAVKSDQFEIEWPKQDHKVFSLGDEGFAIMSSTTPAITDPTEFALPFHQCNRCFGMLDKRIGYCQSCGKTHLSIMLDLLPGQRCIDHPYVEAKALCRLCNDPICSDCVGASGRPLGGEPDYTCKKCMIQMEQLNQSFGPSHSLVHPPVRDRRKRLRRV
jgi:hypothetical protein